jgi:hypothetical protein
MGNRSWPLSMDFDQLGDRLGLVLEVGREN